MTTLRLLLLDDNPDDRALALRELHRQFGHVDATEVNDRAGFESALEAAGFDVVVTDYQMQWTTGMEVLERVKTRWPRLPVIMFTATATQEIAVEAMKAGLDDYVLKSPRHYVRLPVAVRACLDHNQIRLRAVRSETRLQALLDHARMGVFRLSTDGVLLDANRALRTMLALDATAALDTASHPLLDAARELASGLDSRGDTAEREVVVPACAGSDDAYYTLRVVRVAVDGDDAIDGLVDDTSSLRRADLALHALNRDLEHRVESRTQALREANESLEAFAYSVSHDLREPVRTLQGYARALQEDFASGRLDDALQFVRRIDDIAARVDGMVGDLLEYSLLSLVALPPDSVDLDVAVDEACGHLAYDPAFRTARLLRHGAPWPAVHAHPGTLVQVLVNLLSNAAKFVAPGVAPEITVNVRQVHDRVRVSVGDNGIGIAAKDQPRIFEVFQRLHGQERYPGTGIGLALVHKAVERMGGHVEVESEPGEGACFTLDLPAVGSVT
ncbi:sensor histidine kinase [Cognatilysobacter bugurensis]|uniref:histidine kinase n=1 Tax=Cognatilysobacter bugurensis TaxID=543356 RepID=A0A918SRZ5_9GAMM|nr:ATP-binding protein [Lysobacter bugurensis]GHA68486.1 hybrid sensor histidine kinase/response regulator [Lysobacter bugurensis]